MERAPELVLDLTDFLGRPVLGPDGRKLGTLDDLAVTLDDRCRPYPASSCAGQADRG